MIFDLRKEKIGNDVHLDGNPTTTTQDRDDDSDKVATTEHALRNRSVAITVINYTSTNQPVNRLKVVLSKAGGTSHTLDATEYVKVGDIIEYHPDDEPIMWSGIITSVIDGNNVQIPENGNTFNGYTTVGFTGGNTLIHGKITPMK